MERTENRNRLELLPSGNSELDRRLGGGLPMSTFILIEGENDSGKSVLTQQFVKGALDAKHRVCLITTETTIPTLLEQMGQIKLSVLEHFLWGRFRVVPLQLEGTRWTKTLRGGALNALYFYFGHERSEVIFIDSLSFLVLEAEENDILSFFTRCRNLTRERYGGKTVVFTLHSDSVSPDILLRIIALVDGHIKLKIGRFGEEFIRIMNVMKFRGSNEPKGLSLSFRVNRAFGLQVIPVEVARA